MSLLTTSLGLVYCFVHVCIMLNLVAGSHSQLMPVQSTIQWLFVDVVAWLRLSLLLRGISQGRRTTHNSCPVAEAALMQSSMLEPCN